MYISLYSNNTNKMRRFKMEIAYFLANGFLLNTKLGDRLNGHILSGHIDGTGVIKSVVNRSNACEIRIGFPIRLKKYIVPKGSVALDGVSLTVAEVGPDWFLAHIIPHTLSSTRLGCVKVGDAVNMESDLMAKYAESNVSGDRGISEDFLKEKGFI